MHQWLVTVRARPSDVALARTLPLDGLLPLLAAAPGCPGESTSPTAGPMGAKRS